MKTWLGSNWHQNQNGTPNPKKERQEMTRAIQQTKATDITKNTHLFGAFSSLLKLFPNVKTVADSKENVEVGVVDKDRKGAKPKDPTLCVMAKGCVRDLHDEFGVEGAYVGLSRAFLIFNNGTHAVRFNTPESLARELTAIDRTKKPTMFALGTYHLSKVPAAKLIGKMKRGKKSTKKHTPRKENGRGHHETLNVRRDK